MRIDVSPQVAWFHGFYLCSMELLLVSWACGWWFAVQALRRREVPLALLSALVPPVPGVAITLLVGWPLARKWGLGPFMGAWAFLFVLALLNVAATFFSLLLSPHDWEVYFGWLPTFQ